MQTKKNHPAEVVTTEKPERDRPMEVPFRESAEEFVSDPKAPRHPAPKRKKH